MSPRAAILLAVAITAAFSAPLGRAVAHQAPGQATAAQAPVDPALALPIPPQPPAPAPSPLLTSYPGVSAAQLAGPQDGEWLMTRRTYDGWGYSPLQQIDTTNVQRLMPVWTLSTGMNNGHEAAPVVNGGVMFVTSSYNQVFALDARTGAVLWRYRSNSPGTVRGKPVNRGVALYGTNVFTVLTEGVLVALDARTGREVWRVTVADNSSGQYTTAPPLVADGKLVVGAAGGDGANRGFVAAYDPATGKQLWRTYTIPSPGEAGHETWRADDWRTGGGATWMTGNYDPATNLAFWGTGNGFPWVGHARPGDNLHIASTLAIDVATGTIKGHFQYTPNESWDWDEVSPPLLIDFRRDGRMHKGLVNFARNGYLYFLERSEGPVKFIEGKPYVKQNVFRRLDAKTGRPDVDESRKPDVGKVADFCPSWHGAKNWQPGAYSPKTRMVYIPTQENICAVMVGRVIQTTGGGTRVATTNRMYIAPGADHLSQVQAWNVDSGKMVWSHHFEKSPNWGPMLATGGGLVFSGGTNDRMLRAFDASTGRVLWQFATNSGIYAPPVSYMLDGTQYIAVLSGWGQDARSMQARIDAGSPGSFPEVPEGGVLWVFALPRNW